MSNKLIYIKCIVVVILILASGMLAYQGAEGWGWFLFVAALLL